MSNMEKHRPSFPLDAHAEYLLHTSLRSLLSGLINIYSNCEHKTPDTIQKIQADRRVIIDVFGFFTSASEFISFHSPLVWNETLYDIDPQFSNPHLSRLFKEGPWSLKLLLSSLLPNWSSVQKLLGYPLFSLDQLSDEEIQLRELIEQEPEHAQAFCNLAVIYLNRGQHEDAVKLFDKSLSINPVAQDTLLNKAVLLTNQGDLPAAEHLLRRAIQINPHYYIAYTNLGYVLSEMERYEEAEAELRNALNINPDYTPALLNITVPLQKRKSFHEAEIMLRHLLNIEPENTGALLNLFVAILSQNRDSEAEDILRQTIDSHPHCAEAMSKLGLFLSQHDKPIEAEIWLRKAYEVSNMSPESAFDLSSFLLICGKYHEGFSLYESRFMVSSNHNPKRFQGDPWDGSELNGKSILIHAEQGFGDNIQCARYLPLIKLLGGKVILETRPELFRLFEQSGVADVLVDSTQNIPEFDTFAPIMSLPHIFGTEIDTIPCQCPYLSVHDELRSSWSQYLTPVSDFRIGIVWAGNPFHKTDESRSIPLNTFSPVSELPNVQLVSLQMGFGSSQVQNCSFPLVLGLSDKISDFADTAAALTCLDLIVCVDTSIAHLAGAMNIPTCLLLAKVSDWRWLQDRSDTPWYPSLKLFRQKVPNDWEEVIQNVCGYIRELQIALDPRQI